MDAMRRRFLYALGGTSAAIAGWMLLPDLVRVVLPAPSKPSHHPRLADGAVVRRIADGGELLRSNGGEGEPVAVVNEWGRQIVESMDGHRTIQDLARILQPDADPRVRERTEAAIVGFLAELGRGGLLAEPFYANIHVAEFEG